MNTYPIDANLSKLRVKMGEERFAEYLQEWNEANFSDISINEISLLKRKPDESGRITVKVLLPENVDHFYIYEDKGNIVLKPVLKN